MARVQILWVIQDRRQGVLAKTLLLRVQLPEVNLREIEHARSAVIRPAQLGRMIVM